MSEVKLNKDNFEKEVLKSDIPVVVDFYADWCGPCKMLAPVLEDVAKMYERKVKVCKINVDNEMELAEKYEIVAIPTLICFKNGNVEYVSSGFLDKNGLTNMFEKLI